ncbi:hypothetical protein [Parasutterella sp.]|uniref:hypothetical protein n=1 Tax=Parasutterella sp. TaxID=2049037 RepID=UPI003AEFD8B9
MATTLLSASFRLEGSSIASKVMPAYKLRLCVSSSAPMDAGGPFCAGLAAFRAPCPHEGFSLFLSMIPFVVVAVTHSVKIRAFLGYCYRVLCRLLTTPGKLYSAKPIGLRP